MNPREELFVRARAVRGVIEKESGVKLGRRGPCPMCSDGRKGDKVFSHSASTGLWKCFRGCGSGDGIRLVEQMTGLRPLEAARHVLGLPLDGSGDAAGLAPAQTEAERQRAEAERRRREREDEKRRAEAQRAHELSVQHRARMVLTIDADLRGAHHAGVSQGVRRYLGEGRALPLAMLEDALERLFALPRAPYTEDFRSGEIIRHPAMAALIEAPQGLIVGRHLTHLRRDGLAKADLSPARKIWGEAKGGVWLTDREPHLGPVFVGEGIETVLARLALHRMQHGKRSGRALAVLSLDNLQGGWATDQWGRVDLEFVRPDFTKPAVTWPRAGRVVLCVDHDMKPLPKAKARKPGGGTLTGLDGTQRMEICARLAAHWWGVALADEVLIARPPAGMDWNDALMAQQRRAA